jgi:hypothetical protein
MKLLFFLSAFFLQFTGFSQKSEYFKDVTFDSSYSVLGICQGYGKPGDSLERFWFIVDNIADLNKLKSDWVFKNPVPQFHGEERSVNIYIVKNKQLTNFWSVIFPKQGIILSGHHYYKFDTSQLLTLHSAHPLHYHSQRMQFDTYTHYSSYGNSIIQDPKLLFLFEPSLSYEGQFSIITRRTNDPASPLFILRDINKELRVIDPSGKFQASQPLNDSFNIASRDRVKFVVRCSKALYDDYQTIGREKGSWEPTPIEITTFWRDDAR